MINNYDNLKIFYYTARLGSMSRAAAELNLTPPTITRTIQTLEQEIGYQLFLRSRNGIQLTDPGKELFHQVRQALDVIELSEDELFGNNASRKSSISILAGNNEWDHFLLPLCIPRFHELHPDVCIRYVRGGFDDFEDKLRSGLADLAVCPAFDLKGSFYSVTPLYSGRDIFIVGEKYKNLCHAGTTLKDLSKLPLILVPEDQVFHIQFRQFMLSKGIQIAPVLYVENVFQQMIAVASGLGYSIVPIAAAFNPLLRGIYPLTKLLIPPLYREVFCLISSNTGTLPPTVQAFCNVIVEQAKKFDLLQP